MKKLNKILAAISTAALTFCVWGTQTQAEVVKNEKGVPVCINAKTKEEFFGDLQQVLNHIESRLVVEGENASDVQKLFMEKNKLPNPPTNNKTTYFTCAEHQYEYALKNGKIHIGIANGYLYNLLINSKIDTQTIKNVYRLAITKSSNTTSDIIFQLPSENDVYYSTCLRWFLQTKWMEKSKLKPKPMTVSEAFDKGPEFAEPKSYIFLNVTHPNSIAKQMIARFSYHKTDLLNHAKTIIPKLISIAGIRIEDEKLGLAFRNHSNLITDYDEFVKKYNETKN